MRHQACDRCEMLAINGCATHETGCPCARAKITHRCDACRRRRARMLRRQRERAMRDVGLTRGRDSMGRVIWE